LIPKRNDSKENEKRDTSLAASSAPSGCGVRIKFSEFIKEQRKGEILFWQAIYERK
jgi:hypothetical protein